MSRGLPYRKPNVSLPMFLCLSLSLSLSISISTSQSPSVSHPPSHFCLSVSAFFSPLAVALSLSLSLSLSFSLCLSRNPLLGRFIPFSSAGSIFLSFSLPDLPPSPHHVDKGSFVSPETLPPPDCLTERHSGAFGFPGEKSLSRAPALASQPGCCRDGNPAGAKPYLWPAAFSAGLCQQGVTQRGVWLGPWERVKLGRVLCIMWPSDPECSPAQKHLRRPPTRQQQNHSSVF